MFELIKTLCDLPGVTGRENTAAEKIEELAKPYADTVYRDALGNFIVFKKGAKTPDKPVMLAAHMDEVGFYVNYITDKGFLKLLAGGGLYGQSLAGRTLFFPRSGLRGVLGKAPIHQRKGDEGKKVPKLDELYVDIGAASKEEAEKYIRLGDVAVFDTQLRRFGDDGIVGKAIDDRLGCALLLEILKTDLPVDCHFAFTVQEEVGLRGAQTAAFAVRPGAAIVVDCCGAADNAGFKDNDKIACSGKGPVVSYADHATLYDYELFDRVCALADANGIPWQTKTRLSGGTDAGAIHKTAAGARVVGISVASRNIHCAASTANLTDAENAKKLIEKTLELFANV
ncbi:MAG: M42 family peptidase [Oscillospiraceae bacterium]|nr:M42 family peptidase [Oscillospiraceae bacterium]